MTHSRYVLVADELEILTLNIAILIIFTNYLDINDANSSPARQ